MVNIFRGITFIFLLTFSLYCAAYPLQSVIETVHPGISVGSGLLYGFEGMAFDLYFFNTDAHHVSFHQGIGLHEYVSPVYCTTLRYGYGNTDRFIVDISYGCIQSIQTDIWTIDKETGDILDYKQEEKAVYRPACLLGYQRLFSTNISITASAGLAYYYKATTFSNKEGEIPFEGVFNVSVGFNL